jgi:hypothetical protein
MSRSDSSSIDIEHWRLEVKKRMKALEVAKQELAAAEDYLRKLEKRRASIMAHSGGDFDD